MRPTRAILTAASGTLALALAAACSTSAPGSQPAPPAATASAPAEPPMTQVAQDLPPLPPGIATAARSPEVVRTVYEFAARHPEVLRYVPCFCACWQMGHKDNEDCFVASRDAAGRVKAWESHGMVCEICIDVAREAMQMHNAGASTSQIRSVIDAKYSVPGQRHTPTPMPPRAGGPSAR